MQKYTQDHEWVRLDGDTATIGITQHAATQLGDLVFVELPEVGRTLAKDEIAATIESVKAASEINAPVDGEVVEINQAIVDDPAIVNNDPVTSGWFFKLKLSDKSALDTLLDEDAYKSLIK